MRTSTVEEALAAIASKNVEDPSGAIAFDGDGTLWSGDIGEDFFAAVLREGLVGEAAAEALRHEARTHGLPDDGAPSTLARRLHEGYLAGAFPEERICEVMTWACAGVSRVRLDALAARVCEEVGLRGRLHRETSRVVAWARDRGVSVCLVSASPRAIVQAAARIVGIEPSLVAAATERVREGDGSDEVLPDVERPIPYGPGKVVAVRRLLGDRRLHAAFGDNSFDVPMLQEAALAFAVRPKPALLARAADVAGISLLSAETEGP